MLLTPRAIKLILFTEATPVIPIDLNMFFTAGIRLAQMFECSSYPAPASSHNPNITYRHQPNPEWRPIGLPNSAWQS